VSDSGVNVVGIVSLCVFYAAVLAIGVWAGVATLKIFSPRKRIKNW
jgi:hypothetical protein